MIVGLLLAGPDTSVVVGAGLLQEPVVQSPLPGGIATVVRFLFNFFPSWFQIAGAVLGVLVALAVLWVLWRRRQSVVTWITTRSPRARLWLGLGAATAVVFAISFGTLSWHYTQHDNGFCTGCHIMGPSFERFTKSEHARLECHDCHQQSIFASMRQVYLWVAERPEEIGPHAKVPTRVCARCHVTGQPEVWQHVASTAGHRTHLESDSSALRGIQCVTCHGVEVHRFRPVSATCGQANCHPSAGIVLGKMASQTDLHCTTCHAFTADVPLLATRDSARGTLVPGMRQCFGCHEMRGVLANFDPARDPHGGTCGMCHNPHVQRRAAEARASCANAGCHADWRTVPFHAGASHRRVSAQCLTCHNAHQARLDASDCTGCHTAARERGRARSAPVPFDTTAALRRTSFRHHAPDVPAPKGKGDAPPPVDPPREVSSLTPPDTFPHDRHTQLACLTCHASPSRQGRLTFAPPRGCQICHHQAPATSICGTCHEGGDYAPPRQVVVRVAVGGREPRERAATFRHETHAGLQCVTCHATPVTLEPKPEALQCRACHAEHHGANRDCAACHSGDAMRAAHAPPVEGHVACAACHADSVVAALVPNRAFCISCHAPQGGHYADRECTTCHFLAAPDAFRRQLAKPAAGGGW